MPAAPPGRFAWRRRPRPAGGRRRRGPRSRGAATCRAAARARARWPACRPLVRPPAGPAARSSVPAGEQRARACRAGSHGEAVDLVAGPCARVGRRRGARRSPPSTRPACAGRRAGGSGPRPSGRPRTTARPVSSAASRTAVRGSGSPASSLALRPGPVVVARAVHERHLEPSRDGRASTSTPAACVDRRAVRSRPGRQRPRPALRRGACGDQVGLQVAQRLAVGARCVPGPGAVRAEVPGGGAASIDRSSSSASSLTCAGSLIRTQRLDPAVEVAVHHVGAADVDRPARRRRANQKIRECSRKRPRMLRTRMFSRQPGHAGPERADAADHEVDGHAGVRRAVQRVDHRLVDDRVDLDRDRAPAGPRARLRDLALDPVDQPAAQRARRDQQAAVARSSARSRTAG